MPHLYENRPRRLRGLIISLAVFALLVAVFVYAVDTTDRTAEREQTALLESAIRRAAISCYATEGRYPQSLEYLREHYGVLVDDARFTVRYDIFASNIMPDITVIDKGEKH